jgi:hypothetical protein
MQLICTNLAIDLYKYLTTYYLFKSNACCNQMWNKALKEFCMLFVGVPAVLSATTASMILTMKYVDKITFETKK